MRLRILLLAALVGGCGLPDNLVVLLPDETGKVGVVKVSTARGAAELNKPMAAVSLTAGEPPSKPFAVEDAPIKKVFGKVLQATPREPTRFTLRFQPNSTAIAPESVGRLTAALRTAKGLADADISIVVYAPAPPPAGRGPAPPGASALPPGAAAPPGASAAPPAEDPALPFLRARSIRDMLVSDGVRPGAIEVANYGPSTPPAPQPGAPQAGPPQGGAPEAGAIPPQPPTEVEVTIR